MSRTPQLGQAASASDGSHDSRELELNPRQAVGTQQQRQFSRMGQVVVEETPDRLQKGHPLLGEHVGGRSAHEPNGDEAPSQFQPVQDLGGRMRWLVRIVPAEERPEFCRFFAQRAVQMQGSSKDNMFGDFPRRPQPGQQPSLQLFVGERRNGA